MTTNIANMLNALADIKLARDEIAQSYDNRIAEITAERDAACRPYDLQVADYTDEIKQLVVERKASVKGAKLHAVYSKPRVTWDGKGLDGYAVAHPEIEAFRKVGKPSVSIRDRK